jgi:hypothetical protein
MPEWLAWTLIGGGILLLLGLLVLLNSGGRPIKGHRRSNESIVQQQASSIRNQTFGP